MNNIIKILLGLTLVGCEYPEIDIGQYDVEIAWSFIWEQGDFVNGEYKTTQIDTIAIGPSCLIGCWAEDSATSLTLINYTYPDTIFLDTSWSWFYTIPK